MKNSKFDNMFNKILTEANFSINNRSKQVATNMLLQQLILHVQQAAIYEYQISIAIDNGDDPNAIQRQQTLLDNENKTINNIKKEILNNCTC